ncbi:MAG: FdhF/YdeP family oxidoreductase [Myxococcales bacterium]|nr:FdhF/YdeP family oxidoreductase [Myxococcales bacterium]
MSPKAPSPQPPQDLRNLLLTQPKEEAAGVEGVLVALRHVHEELGLVRGLGVLSQMNQKQGFDCPGCAWPDPDDHRSSLGEYCENGVKAIAEEATTKRVTPAFFAQYTISELAQHSDHWLGKQGRLTHPMYKSKGSDHYTSLTWEEAFERIAKHLQDLEDPNEAIFYTSGRTSNEAAFLYQLFVRLYGTNNLPDCSNMCHESSGTGLKETIGIGKGTVTLDDFSKAGTIIVIGQNPGTNHPRMLSALQDAKRHGAKIISINPLNEAGLKRFKHPQEIRGVLGGTPLADLFLQVRINGDVALLKGFAKEMFEREAKAPNTILDNDFIQQKTLDFDAFAQDIHQTSWDEITENSGISREEIQQAVDIFTQSRRTIYCWAMGLTQHQNGVANIQMCTNLLLMQGAVGKPGAGACPVRGHSNVQGDRTVGIWERPPKDFLDRLGQAVGFEPPQEHGYDVVAAIQAMLDRKAHVFFALGGNFLSATPDTELTAQALQNCRLTVQVSTKLNRSHLIAGEESLILPCLARSEQDIQDGTPQFVTVENSMGIVHTSQGSLPPASEQLLSEPMIVARLAQATLQDRALLPWHDLAQHYDKIRDLIERSIPGFDQYNKRVRQPGGFYLPNGPREGRFDTPSQKALFKTHPIPKHELGPDQFMMMTIRSHDQYNTTIYGLDDRYRGIYNERRVVLIHPLDLKEAGFTSRQVVDLIGEYKGEVRIAERFRLVPYPIPRRCVATYFPEANVLVPLHHKAERSHTPASKSIPIRIIPSKSASPQDLDYNESEETL